MSNIIPYQETTRIWSIMNQGTIDSCMREMPWLSEEEIYFAIGQTGGMEASISALLRSNGCRAWLANPTYGWLGVNYSEDAVVGQPIGSISDMAQPLPVNLLDDSKDPNRWIPVNALDGIAVAGTMRIDGQNNATSLVYRTITVTAGVVHNVYIKGMGTMPTAQYRVRIQNGVYGTTAGEVVLSTVTGVGLNSTGQQFTPTGTTITVIIDVLVNATQPTSVDIYAINVRRTVAGAASNSSLTAGARPTLRYDWRNIGEPNLRINAWVARNTTIQTVGDYNLVTATVANGWVSTSIATAVGTDYEFMCEVANGKAPDDVMIGSADGVGDVTVQLTPSDTNIAVKFRAKGTTTFISLDCAASIGSQFQVRLAGSTVRKALPYLNRKDFFMDFPTNTALLDAVWVTGSPTGNLRMYYLNGTFQDYPVTANNIRLDRPSGITDSNLRLVRGAVYTAAPLAAPNQIIVDKFFGVP